MASARRMHMKLVRRPSPRSLRALAPRPLGWRTTDADELALRRERAVTEPMRIENLDRAAPVFSTFRATSASGASYQVEVRSLIERENSCACPDFRTNGLGTCKHVEAVIARLRRTPAGRGALQRGGRSTLGEIFLKRSDSAPEVVTVLPEQALSRPAAEILQRYLDAQGRLQGDPAEAVPALLREVEGCGAEVRISGEVVAWAADRARRAARAVERHQLEDELRSGRRRLEALKLPTTGDANAPFSGAHGERVSGAAGELEDLQAAEARIENPVVPDAGRMRKLFCTIAINASQCPTV